MVTAAQGLAVNPILARVSGLLEQEPHRHWRKAVGGDRWVHSTHLVPSSSVREVEPGAEESHRWLADMICLLRVNCGHAAAHLSIRSVLSFLPAFAAFAFAVRP